MEKKNDFATNDWQGTHIFVFLVDFVQFISGTNFVRGSSFSGLSAVDGRKIV